MNDDYVKPPQRGKEEEYVEPPHQKNTVVMPNRPAEGYVAPPSKDDYVAPPTKASEEYVAPPTGRTIPYSSADRQNSDPYDNPTYFGTPKVGMMFYLTGYLVLSLLFLWMDDYRSGFEKLLGTAYVLLSNYTYAWFADYQRYKGGPFAWFFTPFGSAKAGWASSLFADYRKAEVSEGFFGGYKVNSHKDFSAQFIHVIVWTCLLECLKYFVVLPIAFVTLFTHKSNIRHYNQLVDQNTV